MNGLSKVDVEAAYHFTEESRQTHREWINYDRKGWLSRTQKSIGGGRRHHEKCVREYSHVIDVLKFFMEQTEGL